MLSVRTIIPSAVNIVYLLTSKKMNTFSGNLQKTLAMNTVSKGNLFEEKAKQIITTAINEGQLGLIPTCCKVFAKRGYFSRDRNSNIVFDLSIEVWPEGAERCHLLYLIECKDYSNHSVPVDDLEEFTSKISQVAGYKAKGVFITTAKLQEAAFNFAKSKDLMLIQVDKQLNAKIILHNAKRKKSLQTDVNVLWSEEAELLSEMGNIFEGEQDNIVDWDAAIKGFLSKQLNSNVGWQQPGAQSAGLEKLSKDLIERITIGILNEFAPTIISHGTDFPFERFVEFIKDKYGLQVFYDLPIPQYKGKEINGYCDIEKKTIHVNGELRGTGQFLFVFAHELAHFLLHSKVMLSQQSYDKMGDSEFDIAMGRYVLINDKHWLEWQANQFAASLIMPHNKLLLKLIQWQISQGISKRGHVWLDEQPCNILDFKKMITILAYKFDVSRTILEYRMADLGLIIYAKKKGYNSYQLFSKVKEPQSISQIINRIFKD